MAVQTQTLGQRRPRSSALRRKEAVSGYLAILPWLLGFLIFTAGPMVFSAYLVFTKWELLTPPRRVGLAHFRFLLLDKTFRTAMWNTTVYTVLSVPLQLAVALGVALLLNLNVRGKNWYRAIIFLPSQTPIVANALLWFFIYSPTYGLANVVMDVLGLPQQRWLWDVNLVKPALIVMAIWSFGGAMIIFLAGLQNVPQSLYEAAEIDRAGSIAKFWHITIPMISPTIFFNLVIDGAGFFRIWWSVAMPLARPALATVAILSILAHWNDFIAPLVYLNTQNNWTLALGIRLLRDQYQINFNLMMAYAVIMTLPVFTVFFIFQKHFVQGITLTGMGGR